MKICPKCGKEFEKKSKSDSYCKECKNAYQNKKRVEKSKIQFENADPDTFVICAVCGLHSACLGQHIAIHGLTAEEYKEKFNSPLFSKKYLDDLSERVKGSNNPGFNHQGKFSVFSDKFIGKTSKEEAIEKVKQTKDENKSHTTRLDYYTSRGVSEEDAKIALKERQRTFSKDICIEKYGEEKGVEIWQERQEKWLASYFDKSDDELVRIQILKNPSFIFIQNYFKFSEEQTINLLKSIDKEEFAKYSNKISYLSNINFKKYKNDLDPEKLRGNTFGYTVDHKFSRLIGFIENIPEEVISCKGNLELMKYDENFSKHCKCSISKEELYKLYEEEL